jgi:hypothetical protein
MPITIDPHIPFTNCHEQRYITQWGISKAPQRFDSLFQERDNHLSESID